MLIPVLLEPFLAMTSLTTVTVILVGTCALLFGFVALMAKLWIKMDKSNERKDAPISFTKPTPTSLHTVLLKNKLSATSDNSKIHNLPPPYPVVAPTPGKEKNNKEILIKSDSIHRQRKVSKEFPIGSHSLPMENKAKEEGLMLQLQANNKPQKEEKTSTHLPPLPQTLTHSPSLLYHKSKKPPQKLSIPLSTTPIKATQNHFKLPDRQSPFITTETTDNQLRLKPAKKFNIHMKQDQWLLLLFKTWLHGVLYKKFAFQLFLNPSISFNKKSKKDKSQNNKFASKANNLMTQQRVTSEAIEPIEKIVLIQKECDSITQTLQEMNTNQSKVSETLVKLCIFAKPAITAKPPKMISAHQELIEFLRQQNDEDEKLIQEMKRLGFG